MVGLRSFHPWPFPDYQQGNTPSTQLNFLSASARVLYLPLSSLQGRGLRWVSSPLRRRPARKVARRAERWARSSTHRETPTRDLLFLSLFLFLFLFLRCRVHKASRNCISLSVVSTTPTARHHCISRPRPSQRKLALRIGTSHMVTVLRRKTTPATRVTGSMMYYYQFPRRYHRRTGYQ